MPEGKLFMKIEEVNDTVIITIDDVSLIVPKNKLGKLIEYLSVIHEETEVRHLIDMTRIARSTI